MSITSIHCRFMCPQAHEFLTTVGLMLLASRVKKNIRQLAIMNMILVVIKEIESVLESTLTSDEDKDEMNYTIAQAKKNIQARKAHTLHSINQDEARTDVLKNLEPNAVLVTLDWAMKFLPKKYRESQSDWFGKRGISCWNFHVGISCCYKKASWSIANTNVRAFFKNAFKIVQLSWLCLRTL